MKWVSLFLGRVQRCRRSLLSHFINGISGATFLKGLLKGERFSELCGEAAEVFLDDVFRRP